MAALTRPTEATYACHENVTVDTTDHQDHTFCGIMFPVEIKQGLPIEKVSINTLSVRGRLGPITIWVTTTVNTNDNHERRRWTKIYEAHHQPSFHRYAPLEIAPVTLKPGERCTFYIHSTLQSDQAIVYDNARKSITYQDDVISVYLGRAHLSTTPFGQTSIWGYQGAWRENRAFVGQIQYGVIYKLWNPNNHANFGYKYDQMVMTLLLCQRRYESPISMLPDDCLYYILNMCGYQWAAACGKKKRGGRNRSRLRRVMQQDTAPSAVSLLVKVLKKPFSWRKTP